MLRTNRSPVAFLREECCPALATCAHAVHSVVAAVWHLSNGHQCHEGVQSCGCRTIKGRSQALQDVLKEVQLLKLQAAEAEGSEDT